MQDNENKFLSSFLYCQVYLQKIGPFLYLLCFFSCSHSSFLKWFVLWPSLNNLPCSFFVSSCLYLSTLPPFFLPHLSLISPPLFLFLTSFFPISLKCMIAEKKQQNAVVGHATKLIANDLKYVQFQPMTNFVFTFNHKIYDWYQSIRLISIISI